MSRRAALILAALLALFAALHAYWALGGTWGLETAIGPGAARPSSGAIWGMSGALVVFAFAALTIARADASPPPLAARVAIWILALGAALVGCLNIVMGTRPAERLGIGPLAVVVALLAAYVASRRRAPRTA